MAMRKHVKELLRVEHIVISQRARCLDEHLVMFVCDTDTDAGNQMIETYFVNHPESSIRYRQQEKQVVYFLLPFDAVPLGLGAKAGKQNVVIHNSDDNKWYCVQYGV